MYRTVFALSLALVSVAAPAQGTLPQDDHIAPTRPVPTGGAPHMAARLVRSDAGEDVYAIIFYKDDEVLSGLTDFIKAKHVTDAHFTGIGATSGADLGYLDIADKAYHPIPVHQQVEVLSLMGDVATFEGKPAIHMHTILGRRDGSTVGGHVWKLVANPTLEVFMTVDKVPLLKKEDAASGMRVIDPLR
jgi:predicted DNA-binding protein with PD1-like motif